MKYPLLKLFAGAIALLLASGCATAASSNSATTATLAAEHGAPAALVTTLQRGERLVLADIEMLATLQVPDDTTLAYLRQTGAAYKLTVAQIDQMRSAGVSPRVIDYLLATPTQAARTGQRTRVWYGYRYPYFGSGHFGGFSHSGGFHGGGHGRSHGGGHHGGHR